MATVENVSRPTSAGPLLELVNLPNKLVLDGVYFNGLHALRRFELRNISQHNLIVKLRSNLGSQIAFQLTNENLPDPTVTKSFNRRNASTLSLASLESSLFSENESDSDDLAGDRLISAGDEPLIPNPMERITTNTVAAAALGVFGTDSVVHGHQFNQLFNYVNHINELEIAPGQSQKVILAFLPESPGKSRRPGEKNEERTSRTDAIASDDETYDMFEVNGLLFFFAYMKSDVTSAVTPSTEFPNMPPSYEGKSVDGNTQATIGDVDSNQLDDDAPSSNPQSPPDYQITVKLRSKVCRSVLWTDIGDTGITFDDCVVGGTYFKDFTVWNRSEIDLYWSLSMLHLSNRPENNWLRITDHDTGEPISGKCIPAYSPRRIRVSFRPREIGEFTYDVQLENANDSSNTIETTINAVVRSAFREESLVISSGNVLDFGDCSTGTWTKQRLILRNVSEASLEISFSADIPGVVFQLKSDEVVHATEFLLTEGDTDESGLLMDKLRDLSLNTSRTVSDASRAPSNASSPPLSPPPDGLRASVHLPSSGSTDLAELIAASGNSYMDDEDDSDGEYVDRTIGEGVGNNGDEFRRIEEMLIRPGTERTVEVCYRADKDPLTADYRGSRLARRSFRITLAYSRHGDPAKEKKAIQCKARTCTSFIEVTPKVVNFGDTDVGTLKSAPVKIINHSDLSARVELRFVSKVLNTFRDEIVIPPKQSIEAKIDIYPRKVNPEYRKQIAVVNLLNRDNDQMVEVQSCNIDKNRVTFHSLFYRILTATSTNFIDFGSVTLNAPVVRTFTIANTSKKRLILELKSSAPGEIQTYTIGEPRPPNNECTPANPAERREKLLETIDRKKWRPLKPDGSAGSLLSVPTASMAALATLTKGRAVATSTEHANRADYLDLASSLGTDGRRSPRRRQQTVTYPFHTLKQLRLQYRERRSSAEDELKPAFEATGGTNSSRSVEAPSKRFDENVVRDLGLPKDLLPMDHTNMAVSKSQSLLNHVLEATEASVDKLVRLLESASGRAPPPLPKVSTEEKYVRAVQHLYRGLANATKDGRLTPASQVEIAAGSDLQIVVIFKPAPDNKPFIQGEPKKQDARLSLKLVEFDRDIQQPQFESLLQSDLDHIPVRELLLRSYLCRSIMDLNQRNINFGSMNKSEPRTKTIVIRNNSEAPLLYAIRKSGSIASGDLIIGEGRMGVVRAYGKREVEFVFDPSLAGPFHERLTIENVNDHDNDQLLSVKANIRKPASFFLESLSIDFGVCMVNEICPITQQIVISNTSFSKTRSFEIRFDPGELRFNRCIGTLAFELVENENDFVDGEDGSGNRRRRPMMMLSKEMEEEIEHMEQKLKIAKRKGRKDKVKKLVEKLEKLRAGIVDDEYVDKPEDNEEKPSAEPETDDKLASAQPEVSLMEDLDSAPRRASVASANAGQPSIQDSSTSALIKRTDHSLVFSLPPRAIRTVATYFRPVAIASLDDFTFKGNGLLTDSILPTASTTGSASSLTSGTTDQVSDVNSALFSPASTPLSTDYYSQRGSTDDNASGTASAPDLCTGVIYVHEYKNTDITKEVAFKASVCYNHVTYLSSLAEAQGAAVTTGTMKRDEDTERESQQSTRTTSPMPALKVARTAEKSPAVGPLVAASEVGETPRSQALVPQMPAALVVEVPRIDLGNLRTSERKDCYFTLTNRSAGSVPFTMSSPADLNVFHFHSCEGVLSQKETRRIDLSIIPMELGPQSQSFTVRDEMSGQTTLVTFCYYGIASTYLRFPTLPDPLSTSAELDFGYCYVDASKKYATLVPYVVENTSQELLYVSAQSNLTHQCFIFTDPGAETPVSDVELGIGGRLTMYIALQPYFGGSSSRKASNESRKVESVNTAGGSPANTVASSNNDYRTLVGGIKFIAQKKVPASSTAPTAEESTSGTEVLRVLTTYTLKFTAIIGMSMMQVSETFIDLGSTRTIAGVYSGYFYVHNLSRRLPLEFRISCPDIFELDTYSGKLETSGENGDDVTSPNSGCPPGNYQLRERISFRMRCPKYGLISDQILVENINNSSQKFAVEVRLFADPGLVELKDFGEGLLMKSSPGRSDVPALEWDEGYLELVSDESAKPGVVPKLVHVEDSAVGDYRRAFRVENLSGRAVRMVPRSDVPVKLAWQLPPGTPDSTLDISESRLSSEVWPPCGGEVVIPVKGKVIAYVTIPNPTPLLNDEKTVKSLNAGKKASCRGILRLEDAEEGTVYKVVTLAANYCVTRGEVVPTTIDVGKVGHFNRWEDVKINFTVRNTAEIGLRYAIELPECLKPTKDESTTEAPCIAAGDSHSIEVLLKPQLLNLSLEGPQLLPVRLRNLFNPKNDMMVNVVAQLTQFQLRFERISSGQLVLPPVTYPRLPNTLPCDNWFTILNSSDEEVKFELGFSFAPYLDDLLRVEVLSRFSNSPLTGSISLGPHGAIEVRVRANAREDIRLSPDHPQFQALTDKENVVFGSIWIASKGQRAESGANGPGVIDSPRMSESISLLGSVTEGQTFNLSEERVEFRTILISDSEQEDEGTEEDEDEHTQVIRTRTSSGHFDALSLKAPEEKENSLRMNLPAQREVIYVTNLSTTFPLEFKVAVEFPMEVPNSVTLFRITPLDDNLCGTVAPGDRLALTFELLDPTIGGISDDIKVLFTDRNSIGRQPQVIYVSIVEDITRSLVDEDNFANADGVERLFWPNRLQSGEEGSAAIVTGQPAVEEPGSSIDEDDVSYSDALSSVSVNVPDRTQPSSASRMSYTESLSSQPRRNAGALYLRGCKRVAESRHTTHSDVDGLYELDLGQQDLGSASPIKKLHVENPTGDRMSYRIRVLDGDTSWISFSRMDGTLEGVRAGGVRDTHAVTLTFATTARGVYSTYFVLENLDNVVDTKTVRVTMEIVGRQNIRRTASSAAPVPSGYTGSPAEQPSNHVFDVYVHGLDPTVSTIHMDNLYFGTEYAARSMVIHNRESVPLEFTVNSSLSHDDETELLFSLSRTTGKLFRTITVEPESHARIYMRLLPSAFSQYTVRRPDSSSPSTVVPGLQPDFTFEESDQRFEKEIEIYVNCRLVKDYQKIVTLHAVCRQPQMLLSQPDCFFRGSVKRREQSDSAAGTKEEGTKDTYQWSIKFHEMSAPLEITNLLADPLDCWVINDSMYFNVEVADEPVLSVPTSAATNNDSNNNNNNSNNNNTHEISNISSNNVVLAPVLSTNNGHGHGQIHANTHHRVSLNIPAHKSRHIRIVPKMDIVGRDADRLRKEKYVVEHVTLYNRRRPRERRYFVIRVSLGHLSEFAIASGSRHSFGVLERAIIRLGREMEAREALDWVEDHPGNASHEILSVFYGTREHVSESYAQLAHLLFSTLFSKPVFKSRAPGLLPPMYLVLPASSTLSASSSAAPTSSISLATSGGTGTPTSVMADTPSTGPITPMWPQHLAKWIRVFLYFMDFFPGQRWPALEPLRALMKGLVLPSAG
ncbi:hypothetical protein HDU85_004724 [Gaertneriomyces sp. JEL0708]|nr:hypothetical protein HDU85_004724 [Gaertneriomyces sp. JEL0708]